MDESEWAETPVVSGAYNTYLESSTANLELAGALYHLFDAVLSHKDDPDFTSKLGLVPDFIIASAERQKATNYEALHTMMVLTAWAQVEALIIDMCVAMLRSDPSLLSRPAFAKAKLPPTVVAMEDIDQRLDALIDVAFDSRYKFDSSGKGKFEKLLEMVDLHGAVPDDLAAGLAELNAVRNVLAHNGGRVNKQFLERCPESAYALGDKIALGKDVATSYLLALQTYTTIVTNRFRVRNGLPPVQCNQSPLNAYVASFEELYPDAIDPTTLVKRAGFGDS